MKILYVGKSGKLQTEDVDDKYMLVEMDDGMHPIPDDAVLKNRETGGDSIVPLFAEILVPHGSETSKESVMTSLRSITLAKQSGEDVSVSSQFRRMMITVTKNLGTIIILMVLAYAFLSGGPIS